MGFIGRVHYEAARAVSHAQVVAVASSRPDVVRRDCPGVSVYSRYEKLFRDDRLDAVILCVPTFLHEPYAQEAARYGRHILCEKPLALDVDGAGRIIAAAQRAGVTLMVGQVLRFWPQYRCIKELAAGGTLGALRTVNAWRLAKFPSWGGCFADPAKSGGCLLDLQIHDIDFVHWILGSPHMVYAAGIESSNGRWDHVLTTLTYEEAVAMTEATCLMPDTWPFTAGIRVVGSQGSLEYLFSVEGNIEGRARALNRLTVYTSGNGVSEPQVAEEDAFVAQLAYFTRCIEHKEQPSLCHPEESYEVMRIMSACRESAKRGQPVAFVGRR
jgi:predicted dehydrogenase